MNRDLSDNEIIDLYKKTSDVECVGILFKRYSRMAFVLCDRILKDPTRSKEAMMQVFENLIVYLKKYQIENFRSWLISVLRNQCFLVERRKSPVLEFYDFYEKNSEEFMEFDELDTLNEKEKQEKQLEELEKAMKQLPQDQAECIQLFYLKGKTYDQIGEITGYSFNQIKSHIQNGKRNLKIIMQKAGGQMLTLLFLNMFFY